MAERLSFIDVGVHDGPTSKTLLSMTDSPNLHIDMFEPNPPFAKRLRSKIKDKRATVHQAALMDYNGRATLRVPYSKASGKNKHLGASLLLREKTKPKWRFESIDVAVMSARDFISALPPGPVVLYCNCEGGEYAIIDDLFKDDTWERITLWSVQIHKSDQLDDIETKYRRLKRRMHAHGIKNIQGEFYAKFPKLRNNYLVEGVLPLIP